MDLPRAAGATLCGVCAARGHMSVRTIPDGNAVSPPQLAADAPILDARSVQPVEIDFFESLGHDLDAAISYSLKRSLCKGINGHKPLGGDHRFDNLTAPLGAWDGRTVWLGFDHETSLFHSGP